MFSWEVPRSYSIIPTSGAALSAFATVPGPIAPSHLGDIAATVSGVEINSKQLFQVMVPPSMVHRD